MFPHCENGVCSPEILEELFTEELTPEKCDYAKWSRIDREMVADTERSEEKDIGGDNNKSSDDGDQKKALEVDNQRKEQSNDDDQKKPQEGHNQNTRQSNDADDKVIVAKDGSSSSAWRIFIGRNIRVSIIGSLMSLLTASILCTF